jgi:lipopolysaccharide transport system ATP-binding protein
MKNDPAILIKNVSKCYRNNDKEFYALNDINLDIRKGDLVGIIGRNGSGKSTLLKLISGVVKPSTGKITISGSLASVLSIGGGFHPDLTGVDNIILHGQLMGLTKKEAIDLIDNVALFSELKHFIHEPIKTYSDGMFLRLAVSTYIFLDYDIYLFDEVLSAGDILFNQKIKAEIQKLVKKNKTVLMVSHDLNMISNFTTHSILLDNGQIVDFDKTSSLIKNYKLDALNAGNSHFDITQGSKIYNKVYEDNNININTISFLSSDIRTLSSSKISIVTEFENKNHAEEYNITYLVKSIDDFMLHADSYAMKKDFFIPRFKCMSITAEYPQHFFNKGIFSFGLIISKGTDLLYMKIENIFYFEIEHTPWASANVWKDFEVYSCYPLNWKIKNNNLN